MSDVSTNTYLRFLETPCIIYMFVSNTWRLYIGYTHDFSNRYYWHKFDSNRINVDGTWKTDHKFYRCARAHGWDSFAIFLVEDLLTEKEAKKREVFWIKHFDSYKNGLNSSEGGEGIGQGANHLKARAVILKDIDTGEEYVFDWIGGAAKWLGIQDGKFMVNVLNGTTKQIYNSDKTHRFAVKYKGDTTPWNLDIKKINYNSSVLCYDKNNNLVCRYESVVDAANDIGVPYHKVSDSAYHRTYMVKDIFYFEYDCPERRAKIGPRIPLKRDYPKYVYTIISDKKMVFKSIRNAASQISGITRERITRSLKKKDLPDEQGNMWFYDD